MNRIVNIAAKSLREEDAEEEERQQLSAPDEIEFVSNYLTDFQDEIEQNEAEDLKSDKKIWHRSRKINKSQEEK